MEGARFGISSDWIGGRCAPTHATKPAAPMASHRPATRLQYAILPRSARLPSLPLLLRERRQPDLVRALSAAGAGRSSAETCKSEALSNTGSQRARACPLFDAITRTHPRRHVQGAGPGPTLRGSI